MSCVHDMKINSKFHIDRGFKESIEQSSGKRFDQMNIPPSYV